jgi:hypothetical protein
VDRSAEYRAPARAANAEPARASFPHAFARRPANDNAVPLGRYAAVGAAAAVVGAIAAIAAWFALG